MTKITNFVYIPSDSPAALGFWLNVNSISLIEDATRPNEKLQLKIWFLDGIPSMVLIGEQANSLLEYLATPQSENTEDGLKRQILGAIKRQAEILQQALEMVTSLEKTVDELVEEFGGIQSYVQERQSLEQAEKLGTD